MLRYYQQHKTITVSYEYLQPLTQYFNDCKNQIENNNLHFKSFDIPHIANIEGIIYNLVNTFAKHHLHFKQVHKLKISYSELATLSKLFKWFDIEKFGAFLLPFEYSIINLLK